MATFDPSKLELARKELVFDSSKLGGEFTPEQMQEAPSPVQPSYAESIRKGFAQEPMPEGAGIGRNVAHFAAEQILPTIGGAAGLPLGPGGVMAGAAAGRAWQKAGSRMGDLLTGREQTKETPMETAKDMALTGFLQGVGEKPVVSSMKGLLAGSAKATDAIAINEVNALIKPKAAQYIYGKNPGKAIIEEGVTGKSFEEVARKVEQKLAEVGKEYEPLLKANANKRLNLSNFTKPIDEALETVKKDPRSHKEVINRLENLKRDLSGAFDDMTTGEAFYPNSFNKVSPKQALELKQRIGVLTKFTGNTGISTPQDTFVNNTLKRMYGNIDNKLDFAIPGIRTVNERYANLLGAHVAATNRNLATMNRRNLAPLAEAVAGLGIGAIAGHPLTGGALGLATAGVHSAINSPSVVTKAAQGLTNKVAPMFRTLAEKTGGAQIPQTLTRVAIENDPLGLFQ